MITFTVAGVPQQKGSKKAYVRGGRAVIVDMNSKYRPWQEAVANAARIAMDGAPPMTGPVHVTMVFFMPRPKTVPKDRMGYPSVYPDWDKLARTVGDGMSGVVYKDDGQICASDVEERYAVDPVDGYSETRGIDPGVHVCVSTMRCRHYSGPMRNGKCRDCGEEL